MNLLDARLGGPGGVEKVDLASITLPISHHRQQALRARAGSTVVFGIRPEDLHTEPPAASHTAIAVNVVAVEALGPEVILVASLPDGQEISARLDRDFHAPAGSELQLYVDLERAHLFDADTGRAIAAE